MLLDREGGRAADRPVKAVDAERPGLLQEGGLVADGEQGQQRAVEEHPIGLLGEVAQEGDGLEQARPEEGVVLAVGLVVLAEESLDQLDQPGDSRLQVVALVVPGLLEPAQVAVRVLGQQPLEDQPEERAVALLDQRGPLPGVEADGYGALQVRVAGHQAQQQVELVRQRGDALHQAQVGQVAPEDGPLHVGEYGRADAVADRLVLDAAVHLNLLQGVGQALLEGQVAQDAGGQQQEKLAQVHVREELVAVEDQPQLPEEPLHPAPQVHESRH